MNFPITKKWHPEIRTPFDQQSADEGSRTPTPHGTRS